MARKEYSANFVHRGHICHLVKSGEKLTVEVLEQIPHSGYGPWDEGRLTRWMISGYDPKVFLSLEQIELSEKLRYVTGPNKESSIFIWEGVHCRLVEYADKRGKRLQMVYSIPHTGYGPWDEKRRLEWQDTYYNPELFADLEIKWQRFMGNRTGRE